MISTIEDAEKRVNEILNDTLNRIKDEMTRKNISASGRTSDSLRVESDDKGMRLVIGGDRTAPAATLEVGRAGGRVPAGFYGIIIQWTRDKGLTFESERERNTFSFFTARKIAAEGTLRHKQNVDVYSLAVRDASDTIRRDITEAFSHIVAAEVKTAKLHNIQ